MLDLRDAARRLGRQLGDLAGRRLGVQAARARVPAAGTLRVALSLDPRRPGGGGRSFAQVLHEHLPGRDVAVTLDPGADVDVYLIFAQHAEPRRVERLKRRGVRIVHRLDERLDPAASPDRLAKHRRIGELNQLADLTIFQSEFARRSLAPVCGRAPWRIIHNGVDPGVFAVGGARTALAGTPAILHTSWSTGASKRLDRLEDLVGALPAGGHLHLVGRHAEAGLTFLDHPAITVLGPRPRHEVAALMRGADVLFFPSENDPCPNTIVEAMACGLPILHHPSGGTLELLAGAGVALEGPLPEALARVRAEALRCRAAGLERAAALTAERVVGRYVDAFRAALEGAPA